MAWNNYKGIPQQSMQKRVEDAQSGKRYGGWKGKGYLVGDDVMPAYVPRDGQNIIRIVPPPEYLELEYFGLDVRFHRDIGFRKDMYLCPKHMGIGNCPICELQTEELWDNNPDLAKSYFPDHRVLMYVLDLHEDNAKKDKLFKWSCPITLADEISAQAKDPETGRFVDLCHPAEAPCVFFTRTGKGRNTKYSQVKVGSKPYPLKDSIEAQLKPIFDLLIVATYDEIQAAVAGEGPEPSEVPVNAYEEDAAAGSKYAQEEPEPEPEVEAEEPEPEAEAEVEEEPSDLLDDMDRDELKKFKVKHKSSIPGFDFTIYKNTADEDIRMQLRAAVEDAGRQDLIKKEGNAKPSVSSTPAATGGGNGGGDRDAEVAAKREEVRNKLKAKLGSK